MNELEVDVSMEDAHAGILEFVEQDSKLGEGNGGGYGESASTARYARSGVRSDSSIPALLPVYFRPAPLPDDGLMLADGGCFTHLFIPAAFLSEAGSMARRIVFVIDVSGSMSGEKLREAKASFAAMIDLLDERHTLLVQPFSNEGTEELWGPRPATAANKDGAKEFVMACLGGFGRSLCKSHVYGPRADLRLGQKAKNRIPVSRSHRTQRLVRHPLKKITKISLNSM